MYCTTLTQPETASVFHGFSSSVSYLPFFSSISPLFVLLLVLAYLGTCSPTVVSTDCGLGDSGTASGSSAGSPWTLASSSRSRWRA